MPEDWDQQLAVLRESLVVLPQLVKGVAPDQLRRAPSPGEWSAHVVVELSSEVVDERERRRTLRGKLSSQTPRPRWQPGERYATYVEGYHHEVGGAGRG